MASTKAHRHYRAAQKQSELQNARGVFVPEEKRTKVMALGVALLIVVFLKGILIGCLLGRKYR